MKKSLIYTRTGDEGSTSLVGGIRVSKTHARLEAYGTVDELNAHLGMLVSLIQDEDSGKLLRYVQHKLFAVGSYLATDRLQTELHVESQVSEDTVEMLEKAIDEIDASLPKLTEFVLPGGCPAASVCHVCRTICRRAERRILQLEEEGECVIDSKVKQFINRLSDYLFILSRKLNRIARHDEIYWDKTCK